MEPYEEYLLANRREIFFVGEITNESAQTLVKKLRFLDDFTPDGKKSKRPCSEDIVLWVNSGGGEVTASVMICETMELLKSNIMTIAFGEVASAAIPIVASGTKGKRFTLPSTYFMTHNLSAGIVGAYNEMTSHMLMIEKTKEDMKDYLLSRTKIGKRRYEKMFQDHAYWFWANEAVKVGIVDGILIK